MKNFYFFTCFLIFAAGLQAQDFKFGKVSLEEVQEKQHFKDPEANAAVLYRSVSTYYVYRENVGLSLITDVHERIKIYNKDGFEWATKELNYYKNGRTVEAITGLKGYTYNVSGGKLVEEKLKKEGIFKDEKSKYTLRTKFTMPAVTEGSVIEYQYSLHSPFVTSIDDILLQYTIPINNLEASVRIPEFFGFIKHFNMRSQLNFSIAEEKSTFNYLSARDANQTRNPVYSQTKYMVNKKDIPALKEEPFLDDLSSYAAFLKWELQYTKFPNSPIENLAQTWEGVTKSIYTEGGYDKELSKTGYFRKDLDELLKGISNPNEKAQKIYNFVKSKVKWNDYLGFMAENGADKAYKDGEGNVGDINLLLTAMLNYAGLKSYPVLVSTKNNGVPLFPTRKGFNYVIVALEDGQNLTLLDATDQYAGFGELPARARNWTGRIIRDKENSDWVDLMPAYQSTSRITLNVKMDLEYKMKGKLTNSMNGFYAKSYREKYLNMNPADYLQVLEKNNGNIKIKDVKTENQRLSGADITQTYDLELQDGLEVINERIYMKPLLFMSRNENPFKADERNFPVMMDFPSLESKIVNIMVPEGFEIESIPESIIVRLKEDSGAFKFITLQNGNFIRIMCEVDLKDFIYTPADYGALKEFYAQMVEKHAEAIVLKKL